MHGPKLWRIMHPTIAGPLSLTTINGATRAVFITGGMLGSSQAASLGIPGGGLGASQAPAGPFYTMPSSHGVYLAAGMLGTGAVAHAHGGFHATGILGGGAPMAPPAPQMLANDGWGTSGLGYMRHRV